MVGTELEWSPRGWSADLGKNLSSNRTGDVAQWVECLPRVLERRVNPQPQSVVLGKRWQEDQKSKAIRSYI